MKKVSRLKDLPLASGFQLTQFQFQPLWKLVQLKEPQPDPQTPEEVQQWFQNNPVTEVCVYLNYITNFGKKIVFSKAHGNHLGNALKPLVTLWACTKPDFSLGFCLCAFKNINQESEDIPLLEGDKFAKNSAMAVDVKHQGLTLARFLRVVTSQELQQYSEQLGRTTASLICQNDTNGHLRHITYADEKRHFAVEIPCFEAQNEQKRTAKEDQRELEAAATMKSFFEHMWKYRMEWTQQRKKILEPLISRLAAYPQDLASLHRGCLRQLQLAAERQLVLLYSEGDSCLRSIQLYFHQFASTLKTEKKRTQVGLKIRDGRILSLHAHQMTLFNIQVKFYFIDVCFSLNHQVNIHISIVIYKYIF